MKIVLIGSGNVAHHLAVAFTAKNIKIEQIFGRNRADLSAISEKTGIPFSTENLAKADLYIIAVKDDAIAEISNLIKDENSLVAHTSGSVSRETLVGNYRKSVFYPLQTFSKNKELDYFEIPIFIDAENEADSKILTNLAEEISKNVSVADDEKRKYIHLTAVFACNFVNHLFARAEEIANENGLPFHYFFPLIDETVSKIKTMSPKLAQTGPAIRNDAEILQKQENLIHNPEQLEIYKTITHSIKKMYEL